MIPLGGTHAHLKVDEAVTAAVQGSEGVRPRAVKVTVDPKGEQLSASATFQEGASLAADFATVAEALDDAVPCMVLVRLQDAAGSVPGAGEEDWGLLAWTPSESPVKLRMLCASSRKTLRDHFGKLKFKEYNITERSEATLAQFLEQTHTLTEGERREAMTREELDQQEVREQVAKEQRAAPKMLAGLVALQIKAQSSFEEAMAQLSAEGGKAVIARLAGPKSEELAGELLESVGSPAQLKGRLPTDEPCYVIMRLSEEKTLLFTWLPEGAPARLRMKCSTFKASVVQLAKDFCKVSAVATAEVCDEDDLTEDLGAAAAPAAEEASAPAAGPKPGGFKPPVGGFALPGMGGGRPPPGGVALPGMGPK